MCPLPAQSCLPNRLSCWKPVQPLQNWASTELRQICCAPVGHWHCSLLRRAETPLLTEADCRSGGLTDGQAIASCPPPPLAQRSSGNCRVRRKPSASRGGLTCCRVGEMFHYALAGFAQQRGLFAKGKGDSFITLWEQSNPPGICQQELQEGAVPFEKTLITKQITGSCNNKPFKIFPSHCFTLC